MTDVIGLVIPFFGLIFMGFLVARITRQPIEALGWMTTFVIYVALPALFFQLLAKTPIEKLTEWGFIFGAVFSTYLIFSMMFVLSVLLSRGDIAGSTIKALASAYGNIGYMGPGLTLLAFGEEAAVPVALIFCFENIMHFAIAPMMMALSGDDKSTPCQTGARGHRQDRAASVHHRHGGRRAAAYFAFQPPMPVERFLEYLSRAAAPCALFAMGVTLALRPLKRVPVELAPIALLKLVAASGALLRDAERDRQFLGGLGLFGRAACGTADRDQCLRHRAAIWRVGPARVGERADHHGVVGRAR